VGNAGFAAMCRYLPCDHLEELNMCATRVTRIPAEFRRFKHLQKFYAWGNTWDESGFTACYNEKENVERALEVAAGLVSFGMKERFDDSLTHMILVLSEQPDPFDEDEDDVMVKPAVGGD
jgi:hypothetical protein